MGWKMDTSIIGEKLRQLRKEKGLTIEALAEKLGVSVGIISEWEHGNKEPRHSSREKLCELYGVTEAELFQAAAQPVKPAVERPVAMEETVATHIAEKVREIPSPRPRPEEPKKEAREEKRPRKQAGIAISPGMKKSMLKELPILIAFLLGLIIVPFFDIGGVSGIVFMALVTWFYILYLLVRASIWAGNTFRAKKGIVTAVASVILLLQVLAINKETAAFSAAILGIKESILARSSKKTAAIVVKQVLECWKKGDYRTAEYYWDEEGVYARLYNVKEYRIVDTAVLSEIPYVRVTARIKSTTKGGFLIDNLWQFFLHEDAKGAWKIAYMGKPSEVQQALSE
jgi:transcriptional regulator with XRE-family HTH domain